MPDTTMQIIMTSLIFLVNHWQEGFCQYSGNAPPVIVLNRNWRIAEDEELGSVIEHVHARDDAGSVLTFGLQPSWQLDGSQYFRINNETGVIYLAKSLRGQAGVQYYLYVTASDGDLLAKTEVWIHVEAADRSGQPDNTSFQQISSASPGRPPNYPSISNRPAPSVSPYLPVPSKPVSILPPSGSTRPSVQHPSTTDISSTELARISSTTESTSTSSSPVLVPAGGGGGRRGNNVSSTLHPGKEETASDIRLTIIPIVVIIGFAPVVGVIIWYARRRFCKEKDKEDVKKVEAGVTNSTMSLDDEQEPTSLQQWLGHRAHSNRYESWGPEGDEGQRKNNEDKWEFPRHHLRVFGILGEGCFGQVWKCEALNINGTKGASIVAVKTLRESAGEKERKDLLQELEVMKLLDIHPNVVTLLGCCTEKDPVFVIMEYVPYGKLQTYLRNSRAEHYYGNLYSCSKHLSSRDLTSFAYQVARGMDYLSNKGIIHRDLAARNILIGEDKVCKVADFGFARDVIANHLYERKSEGRLPIRWMAPESLYDNIFTNKTDVWSFGILMWEIVTLGSTPYPGMAAAEVMKHVRDRFRLEKPEHCKREIYNIMYYCWDSDPKKRPSFKELVHTLESLLMTETDYIELDRFPEHAYYNLHSLSGEKL